MTERTVQVELNILGRTFRLKCTPSVESMLTKAAEKLDADLRADLGENEASAKRMLDHLVAVTLEYLCEEMDSTAEKEREAMKRRIEAATSRLHEIDTELSDP